MPYAEQGEPREELKIWLQDNNVTYAMLADRCGVSRQAIGQYANGCLHSQVIRAELTHMGCPKTYLKKRQVRSAPREMVQVRQSTEYYDPWAEGDIKGPYGVPSNSILMCPMRGGWG